MDDRKWLIVGLLINSALYISTVFALGIVEHNAVASKLAVATAGVTYLSYFAQLSDGARQISSVLVVTSILAGVAAGAALILG